MRIINFSYDSIIVDYEMIIIYFYFYNNNYNNNLLKFLFS